MNKAGIHYFVKAILAALLIQAAIPYSQAEQRFELDDIAGQHQKIHFQDYQGKVILLDFWASWCGPCRQSFPWMNEMQAKYAGQGLAIIAINLDSESDVAREFLTEVPASFVLGFDPEGKSAEAMQVEAMPMSYLIDRHGQIRYRLMGFNSEKKSEHETHIQTLLSEPER